MGRVVLDKPVTSEPAAQAATLAAAFLLVPAVLVGLAALMVRLRRSTGLERRQVMVLLVAAAILVAATAIQGIVPSPADVVIQAAAVAPGTVAIGVAVTRHRLYELDTAVCRALVGGQPRRMSGRRSTSPSSRSLDGLTGYRTGVSAAVAAGLAGVRSSRSPDGSAPGSTGCTTGLRADPYADVDPAVLGPGHDRPDVYRVPAAVCRDGPRGVPAPRFRAVPGVRSTCRPSPRPRMGRPGHERFALWHPVRRGWLSSPPAPGEVGWPAGPVILQGIADQVAPSVAALHLHRELQIAGSRWSRPARTSGSSFGGTCTTVSVRRLAGLRLQLESAQAMVREPTAGGLLDRLTST